jgi:hypothetical protein
MAFPLIPLIAAAAPALGGLFNAAGQASAAESAAGSGSAAGYIVGPITFGSKVVGRDNRADTSASQTASQSATPGGPGSAMQPSAAGAPLDLQPFAIGGGILLAAAIVAFFITRKK